MGLYVSHMGTVKIQEERSLYIYLLDFGWPNGEWEGLFKRHFMHMADKATETGAVVIGSGNGIHFGNEVLSWHKVGDLDAEKVLPGLLITKTHPGYFGEHFYGEGPTQPELHDLLVVPLKPFCQDESDFLAAIEGIFSDLKNDVSLKNFRVAKHDIRKPKVPELGRRLAHAIEVKPGAFGLSLDVKALLFPGLTP
ncbi:MAG: hypothetical protein Q7T19_04310 [Caulobacter sp.]|nr:hypothetical protein [Caulobacter sp.]